MALIKCSECGKEISDKATTCPNCGCPINKSKSNKKKSNEEKILKEKLYDNAENESWKSTIGTFLLIWLFAIFPIGIIFSIFSEFLGIFIELIIPFIIFCYLLYDTFGTKEKRKKQRIIKEIIKEKNYKATHNEDGTKKTSSQLKQEKAQAELNRINSLGVYPTKIISKNFVHSIVYFDDTNEKILFKTFYNEYVVDYKDILDFELVVNNTTQLKYTISTSITGTFKTKGVVKDILVRIYLNNIDTPMIEVRSLGDGSYHNENSSTVFEAQQFANELIGTLTYIKNKEKK